MSDNVTLNPGAGGDQVAADEVGGVKYQRVKVAVGGDGVAADATPDTPLPVSVYGELVEALEAMRMALQAMTRTMGQMQPDTAARMRVAVDSITAGLTLASLTTVTTVTTVATLTNQVNIGGLAATEHIPSLMRLGADSARRNITVS